MSEEEQVETVEMSSHVDELISPTENPKEDNKDDELIDAAEEETETETNPSDEEDSATSATSDNGIAKATEGKQYKQQRQIELDELRKKRLAHKLREGLAHGT